MVTAFQLQKNLTNLTGGTFRNILMVHANEDSSFDLTWDEGKPDELTDTINMVAGSDFMIGSGKEGASITITSGNVHLQR